MTRSRAISERRDTLPFVRTGLEIGRVTRGTIWRKRWKRPRDGLSVAAVAVGTAQVYPVVTRVAARLMIENQRRPEISAVASVALELRNEMTVVFPVAVVPL